MKKIDLDMGWGRKCPPPKREKSQRQHSNPHQAKKRKGGQNIFMGRGEGILEG